MNEKKGGSVDRSADDLVGDIREGFGLRSERAEPTARERVLETGEDRLQKLSAELEKYRRFLVAVLSIDEAAVTGLKYVGRKTAETVGGVASEVVEGLTSVKEGLSSLAQTIAEFGNDVINGAGNRIQKAKDGFKTAKNDIVEGILEHRLKNVERKAEGALREQAALKGTLEEKRDLRLKDTLAKIGQLRELKGKVS